jgi:hypothetical protein
MACRPAGRKRRREGERREMGGKEGEEGRGRRDGKEGSRGAIAPRQSPPRKTIFFKFLNKQKEIVL